MNVYLIKNGESGGPFTVEQVVALVRGGQYIMSDLAWREGMAEWQPLHTLEDLVSAILPAMPRTPGTPPPIPQQAPILEQKSITNAEVCCSGKLRIPAILLCMFLGGFGLHAFYCGRPKQGLLFVGIFLVWFFLMSVGGFAQSDIILGLGTLWGLGFSLLCLVTTFLIALGQYKDGKGLLVRKWI
jgi:TM2 domain-containing membrane protein YozV